MSYGTRRCSPQLSGSTVKRRVRSGHFDHDFWIFTLLLVGLRNENLQMLQNGANLAQPPEVER